MKSRNQLLLPNSKIPQKTPLKKSKLCHDILTYSKGYCAVSSIHCMSNITNPRYGYLERVIWLLFLIVATCCSLYVYNELTELYFAERLVTLVDDSIAPIYTVPFPSVSICPRYRINWPKLLVAHQLFLSPNATSEAIMTFRQFFGILDDFRFGKFSQLQPLTATNLNLSLLADVNVKEVLENTALKCNEVFQQPCIWRQKEYNCCELFTMELTENGFCFIFNALVTENNREKQRNNHYYPYRNSDIGEGTGLDVLVNHDETKHQPNTTEVNGIYVSYDYTVQQFYLGSLSGGVTILTQAEIPAVCHTVVVKRPEKWYDFSSFIAYNTHTKVPVRPQLTQVDVRARVLKPEERKCFFPFESGHPLYKTLPGLHFGLANCYSRCRQEYVFKYCKCNLDLCFPHQASAALYILYAILMLLTSSLYLFSFNQYVDNMPACKAVDFKCFYKYRDLFILNLELSSRDSENVQGEVGSKMKCNCYSDCTKLVYDENYINMPIERVNNESVLKQVHLDVYYTSTYFTTYRTQIRYTFVELLGSLGGIFCLFLGGSLMSAVELIYYFTIGLIMHLYERGYTLKALFTTGKLKTKSPNLQKKLFNQRRSDRDRREETPIFYLRP